MEKLPEGVYKLSPESVETLRRAAEKAAAAEAKHTRNNFENGFFSNLDRSKVNIIKRGS